jgi:hypothetical protein
MSQFVSVTFVAASAIAPNDSPAGSDSKLVRHSASRVHVRDDEQDRTPTLPATPVARRAVAPK